MPKLLMFDATVHLGQFTLSSQTVRLGCKQSQISLGTKSETIHAGLWTDNENGRVDNAVWALPPVLQDRFYPFMDHFFSIKLINQIPLEEIDVKHALGLMDAGWRLTFQSAYTCAVAINHKVFQLHTLYTDLLSKPLVEHMRLHHGILVTQPLSRQEAFYTDDVLETAYQQSLAAFSNARVDILEQICDPRTRITTASHADFEGL